MVRTTVYLPTDLINLVKMKALEEKTSMGKLVVDGLKLKLGLKAKKRKFRIGSYNFGNYKFRRADAYE